MQHLSSPAAPKRPASERSFPSAKNPSLPPGLTHTHTRTNATYLRGRSSRHVTKAHPDCSPTTCSAIAPFSHAAAPVAGTGIVAVTGAEEMPAAVVGVCALPEAGEASCCGHGRSFVTNTKLPGPHSPPTARYPATEHTAVGAGRKYGSRSAMMAT